MMALKYAVRLIPDEDGGYIARARDVRGAIAQGDTVEEALAEMSEAMSAALGYGSSNPFEYPGPTPPEEGEYMVEVAPYIPE